MPLSSVTGESIYAEEVYYVDPATLGTKTFICRNPVYPNSMNMVWNGLLVPKTAYRVQSNSCIFNIDFPLTLNDEIVCNYTIGD